MVYIPKPTPCYIDRYEYYKVIEGRKVYRGKDRYYSWDEFHGEIEVFDKFGNHLGALDAISGEKIKRAKKGRRLHV